MSELLIMLDVMGPVWRSRSLLYLDIEELAANCIVTGLWEELRDKQQAAEKSEKHLNALCDLQYSRGRNTVKTPHKKAIPLCWHENTTQSWANEEKQQ